jgi:DNA-binding LytR/AlgR family response regulator
MKVLIIEDEPISSEKIVNYLYRYDQSIEVVARLDSVESSIQWFRENDHPDLVFIDIYLSDGICFSIFDEVDVRAPVIFTTAHDSYALRAFELNSIDYLLKPIKYEALSNALKKYSQMAGEIYLKDISARMIRLLESLNLGEEQYKSRFLVKSRNKIRYIDTKQIAYFYAESKLTFLVTEGNDKFIIDNSLNIVQNQLDPKYFFRVNRKFLIHIKSLKTIHPFFKGRLKIELDPPFQEEILISSEKAQLFKEWLDQ